MTSKPALCPACGESIGCDDHTMCEGCGDDMHEACDAGSNHPRIDMWCGQCSYGIDEREVYVGPFPGMTHRAAEKQPDDAPTCVRCCKRATLYKVDNFVLEGYRCDACPSGGVAWKENEPEARARYVELQGEIRMKPTSKRLTREELGRMRMAANLLPPPGGKVLIDLIDDYLSLLDEIEATEVSI